jgi:hypothetical protein
MMKSAKRERNEIQRAATPTTKTIRIVAFVPAPMLASALTSPMMWIAFQNL